MGNISSNGGCSIDMLVFFFWGGGYTQKLNNIWSLSFRVARTDVWTEMHSIVKSQKGFLIYKVGPFQLSIESQPL